MPRSGGRARSPRTKSTPRRIRSRSVLSGGGQPRTAVGPASTGGGVSTVSKLLALGSLGILLASIILLATGANELSTFELAFGLALIGYAAGAAADAVHRRRCDRSMRADRFVTARVLWSSSLTVALVGAFLAAGEAAL